MLIRCPAIDIFYGKVRIMESGTMATEMAKITYLKWHNDLRNGWHNMTEMGGTMISEIARTAKSPTLRGHIFTFKRPIGP